MTKPSKLKDILDENFKIDGVLTKVFQPYQAEAAIKAAWLELVGEDEIEPNTYTHGSSGIAMRARDKLRAELRAKIKEA